MNKDFEQRDSLLSLLAAYQGARDFTQEVMRIANGGSRSPSGECLWPTQGAAKAEERSKIRAVVYFLGTSREVLRKVLGDIDEAHSRLGVLRCEIARQLIIVDPILELRGYEVGFYGVVEVMKMAAERDATLKGRISEIQKELILLDSKINQEPQFSSSPQLGVTNENASKASKQNGSGDSQNRLAKPSKKALLAFGMARLRGIRPQSRIAELMTEMGYPATQGQVSKWLRQVEDQLEAGYISIQDLLPALSSDPTILDLGKRRDGRTPRQRGRRR